MLLFVFLMVALAMVASALSINASSTDEVMYYREQIQIVQARSLYEGMASHSNQLGIWPGVAGSASTTRDINLSILREYLDGVVDVSGLGLLRDDASNPLRRFLGYAKSSSTEGHYDLERGMIFLVNPDEVEHDTFLSADRNTCGESFSHGDGWCPPLFAKSPYTLYRSNAESAQVGEMMRQEVRLKRLSQRVAIHRGATGKYPEVISTPEVLPAGGEPLYLQVTDFQGDSLSPPLSTLDTCDSSRAMYWDGIPVSCRDLFSVWHVPRNSNQFVRLSSGFPDIDLEARVSSPVYVYASDSTFLLFARSPYAISAGNHRAGEPAYVYSDLSF